MEDIDFWKGIILFGLNQATYKIALGKTLLELTEKRKSIVEWSELSEAFLNNYIDRLEYNKAPQQSNIARRTKMEQIVSQLNLNLISKEEAIIKVGQEAFNDVIPRFHSIGTDSKIAENYFYLTTFGKEIQLKDSLFKITETNKLELNEELNARWSLLEGAFTLNENNWNLSNDLREIYLLNGYERKPLTKNIPFLQGYQANICFYCGEAISNNDIHVDHVIPRAVINNDEVWNLVLSHSSCNLHKNDFLVGKHYIEKLIARNENIMGSNHPWKAKISIALGTTSLKRARSLWKVYQDAEIILHYRYWENSPRYNRETDPFFKKLITKLNNK